MSEQSRFEIERSGLRITAVKSSQERPGRLAHYDRALLYRYDSKRRARRQATRRTRDQ